MSSYLYIDDPIICDAIFEYILSYKFPLVVSLDTESDQISKSELKPPFDVLQLCFDGDLKLDKMSIHRLETENLVVSMLDNLPHFKNDVNNIEKDIDELKSTTIVISIASFWKLFIEEYPPSRDRRSRDEYPSLENPSLEHKLEMTKSFGKYLNDNTPSLISLLTDCNIVKVGCAIKEDIFDFEIMMEIKLPSTIDIQTIARSVGESQISLDSLSKLYLKRSKYKLSSWRVNWSAKIFTQSMLEYAVTDDILTLRVYQQMIKPSILNKNKIVKNINPSPSCNNSSFNNSSFNNSSPSPRHSSFSFNDPPSLKHSSFSFNDPPSISSISPFFNNLSPLLSPLFYNVNNKIDSKLAGQKSSFIDEKDYFDIQEEILELPTDIRSSTLESSDTPISSKSLLDEDDMNAYNHLKNFNIFKGNRDPHISKVLNCLINTYGDWCKKYNKQIRINKATSLIYKLKDEKLIFEDPVTKTISLELKIFYSKDEWITRNMGNTENIKIMANKLKKQFKKPIYPHIAINIISNILFMSGKDKNMQKILAYFTFSGMIEAKYAGYTSSNMVIFN